jgi:hypothetical protein
MEITGHSLGAAYHMFRCVWRLRIIVLYSTADQR